ncbi:alpha/beta fold hydrolase [Streptomyces sp. NPDC012769]|uniref:alpha/beta fold hydrolase n=1 Tax=Streptomyces sp. NPDC012769 TaxID=3364848 RepID=UPI0036BA187B
MDSLDAMAAIDSFAGADGTRLAHRATGSGAPLLCVPGGPADSAYLGDLGGLTAHRTLVIPDLRGTGRSATPRDPATYRCDRLVDDVEALRVHLGLERIDLLGHSAGANIATQYAARHPHRVARLALVTPGTRAVGIDITAADRMALARLRAREPWFPEAFAALEAINAGTGADWEAVAPFRYGRWDEAARRHHAAGRPGTPEALARFGTEGAFTPAATRAALAALDGVPVLLLAGELDPNSPPGAVAEFAGLFPDAAFTVLPGAGHYPWLDDPELFTAAMTAFLGAGAAPAQS